MAVNTIEITDARPHPAKRVLHLLDAENLLGGAGFTATEAALGRAAYEAAAPSGSGDLVVLATSHHAAPVAWFVWPATARRLVRSGRDGADLELLRVLEAEAVAERFNHVVI